MSTDQKREPTHMHSTGLQQLTEILIKHYGLHNGRYQLAVGFRLGVGPIAGPGGIDQIPGAVVGVENIGLVLVPDGMNSADIMDAAVVNPPPVKKTKFPKAK